MDTDNKRTDTQATHRVLCGEVKLQRAVIETSFVRQPSSVASDDTHLLEFTPYAILSSCVLTSHSLLEITYGKSDRLSLLLLGYQTLSLALHTFALTKQVAMFLSFPVDRQEPEGGH